jgi:glycosyltransferase involved in cell wall biosynthesis
MRLVYLVKPASFFISHRLHIALEAQRQGYEVHLITWGKQKHLDFLKEKNIQVHGFHMPKSTSAILKEIQILWRIIKIYWKIKPEICHHVTMRMIVYGMIAAFFSRPSKIVNAYSGLGFVFTHQTWPIKIIRHTLQLIMLIFRQPKKQDAIFQNDDDKQEIINYKLEVESHCHLIRGAGVDLSHFMPFPEPDRNLLKIVFPARLLKDKGLYEFIAAIKIVRRVYPDIFVQLAGDVDSGNPSSVDMEIVGKWKEDGIINQFGFIEDMAELYRSCNIVCLPSYREGLPKSLLEAAASGRAIITTDVPGCRELYDEDNKAVIIVPSKEIRPLADAIMLLITNQSLRNELGIKGRLLIEKCFSEETVRDQTMEVYKI